MLGCSVIVHVETRRAKAYRRTAQTARSGDEFDISIAADDPTEPVKILVHLWVLSADADRYSSTTYTAAASIHNLFLTAMQDK